MLWVWVVSCGLILVWFVAVGLYYAWRDRRRR
jgi:uncharacterized protein YneF (UPF0154 family)